jgi:hypothetical protein
LPLRLAGRKLATTMDGLAASVVFLCLAGVVAVVGANGSLRQAQREFQSRLRNAALGRARHFLVGAIVMWGGAGVLAAFATPETATAAVQSVPAAPPVPHAPLQLRIDHDINFTGR